MRLARLVRSRFAAALALAGLAAGTLAAPLHAATYRNHIARVPSLPNALQSARIWMESDTAFGETAGVEYQVGTTFTKVLGVFDTSGPAPTHEKSATFSPSNRLPRAATGETCATDGRRVAAVSTRAWSWPRRGARRRYTIGVSLNLANGPGWVTPSTSIQ